MTLVATTCASLERLDSPEKPERRVEALGDLSISPGSETDLFETLDLDGDGLIDAEEMNELVQGTRDGPGQREVESYARSENVHMSVQRSITELDRNHDGSIDKDELSMYMHQLAPLVSTEETVMWVEHALQLPHAVVGRFRDQGLTGHDFPELLQNGGELLESELEVSPAVKTRVMSALKTKLTGSGFHPLTPDSVEANAPREPVGCGMLAVRWEIPRDARGGVLPSHRAVLQRHASVGLQHAGGSTTSSSSSSSSGGGGHQANIGYASAWVTVYAGGETAFMDTGLGLGLAAGTRVDYRLSAWNAVGRSDFVYFHGKTLGQVGVLTTPCNHHSTASLHP
jgi:Ca2+-binding EF-hand superfamily protein